MAFIFWHGSLPSLSLFYLFAKNFNILYFRYINIILKLAWETSVAQGTHIYYPAVYTRLGVNCDFSYFSLESGLRISIPKKLFHRSPEFHNQNLRKIGQGVFELWSDIQTNMQRLQLYKYRDYTLYYSNKHKTKILNGRNILILLQFNPFI